MNEPQTDPGAASDNITLDAVFKAADQLLSDLTWLSTDLVARTNAMPFIGAQGAGGSQLRAVTLLMGVHDLRAQLSELHDLCVPPAPVQVAPEPSPLDVTKSLLEQAAIEVSVPHPLPLEVASQLERAEKFAQDADED